MEKTPEEIYQMMIDNPGHAYITPDRKKMYLLVPEKGLIEMTAEGNWSDYSDEEINRAIQDFLLDQM